ncbi:MAG TPA: acyl-protein synthetase [Polyangiaceae bacterium]|nr:acyl-protein synthetase [Polyangiaceae bacterium]
MNFATESDVLHGRVQAFARGEGIDTFDGLALAIAAYQRTHSPAFERLVRRHASALDSVDSIPAVPAEAFRLTRVAVHPKELDQVRFRTSGTSSADTGTHAMRRLDTYRLLSVGFGRAALAASLGESAVVAALAPDPGRPEVSSLGCMMRFFMHEFGVAGERWLLEPDGVDLGALEDALATARSENRPLLVLATAFALVALLDRLGAASLRAPEQTLVMLTGGFKGKSRSIEPERLRHQVAALFAIDPARVVGEYGMTELTSQLYEGTAPGAELQGPPGVDLEPSWLRVTPVDPVSLAPVAEGEVGLARFVDLGNIDSAVAIVTEDLIRRVGPGIELLGRRPTSVPRGCSLALESLLIGTREG